MERRVCQGQVSFVRLWYFTQRDEWFTQRGKARKGGFFYCTQRRSVFDGGLSSLSSYDLLLCIPMPHCMQ